MLLESTRLGTSHTVWALAVKNGDEPPHQILLYTLLFSLFHYFLYIADPPLHTPTDMTACNCIWHNMFAPAHTQHLPLLHQTGLAYLMDRCFTIHMLYVFPFLVAQHVPSHSPTNHESLQPHGQALTIALLWMSLMLSFLLTIHI